MKVNLTIWIALLLVNSFFTSSKNSYYIMIISKQPHNLLSDNVFIIPESSKLSPPIEKLKIYSYVNGKKYINNNLYYVMYKNVLHNGGALLNTSRYANAICCETERNSNTKSQIADSIIENFNNDKNFNDFFYLKRNEYKIAQKTFNEHNNSTTIYVYAAKINSELCQCKSVTDSVSFHLPASPKIAKLLPSEKKKLADFVSSIIARNY